MSRRRQRTTPGPRGVKFRDGRKREIPLALATAVAFFALLTSLRLLGQIPVWLVAAYGVFSAMAFMIYGADKSAAVRGTGRTSESTLHTIGLLGGWPGALVARQVIRHTTTKQPFRTIFWATVVANGVALGLFAFRT